VYQIAGKYLRGLTIRGSIRRLAAVYGSDRRPLCMWSRIWYRDVRREAGTSSTSSSVMPHTGVRRQRDFLRVLRASCGAVGARRSNGRGQSRPNLADGVTTPEI